MEAITPNAEVATQRERMHVITRPDSAHKSSGKIQETGPRQAFDPWSYQIARRRPGRFDRSSEWKGHVPFAMALIEMTRPRRVVELGTEHGISFCAFCQAVDQLGLSTQLWAVDSWEGDPHTGFYSSETLEDLKSYHDPLYGHFSCLFQTTFEKAKQSFEEHSIDVLHVDGLHTYEAVSKDFEQWLPKMSSQGVILFHDTRVFSKGFGVWQFWNEVSERYPSFEFFHEHGLGVLAVGEECSDEVLKLCQSTEPEANSIRECFRYIADNNKSIFKLSISNNEIALRDQEIRRLNNRIAESRLERVSRKMLGAVRQVRAMIRGNAAGPQSATSKNIDLLSSDEYRMDARNLWFAPMGESSPGAGLYLDMLKRSLLDWIHGDAPIAIDTAQGKVVSTITGENIRMISPTPINPEVRFEGKDWPASATSMIGKLRMDNLQQCVETVLRDEVPGDLVETGIWRGGSIVLMRAVLAAYGDSHNRRVWGFDSFEGLPKPDEEAYPADTNDNHYQADQLAVSRDEVEQNIARYGLLDDRVKLVKGWFRDTLPDAEVEQIAVLRLDGDMYESTILALESLYPRVPTGGFVIIDDYGCVEGCRLAVDEFRTEHGISDPIETIDWTGVFWRKS